MQGAVLLNAVILQGVAIFQLLAGEDKPLLVRRNTFLILNFVFYIFYAVCGLYLQGDMLARQGLDKNLHGKNRR